MKDRKTKKKIREIAWRAALVVSLCVFVFCAYRLIAIQLEYKAGTEEYDSLREIAMETTPEATPTPEAEEPEETPQDNTPVEGDEVAAQTSRNFEAPDINFDALREINSEVVGWIVMESIDISYPIVKAEDNDKYLGTTFEGKKNGAGAIFMEHTNQPDFNDCNTLIYGHNMKNGSMFGSLNKILEEAVYSKSRYFWICTPEGKYRYEIFSAYETPADGETYTLFSEPGEEFKAYLDAMKEKSALPQITIPLTGNDKVVTLSTCTANSANRFVVQGKRV